MIGTIAYLTKSMDRGILLPQAAVHLDMVGGDPFVTKSVLHLTRSPWSIATVTDDVMETFGRYAIDGAMRAAGEGDVTRALQSPGGSRDALWADITPYESGSDHWIYQEGGFRVPAVYLRDHPDIYIHTTGDIADHIEPTKIKRSAFIAAASGYYLSRVPDGGRSLVDIAYANAMERFAEDGRRAVARSASQPREAAILVGQAALREQRRLLSLGSFVPGDPAAAKAAASDIAEAARRLLMRFMSTSEAERFASAGFHVPPTDTRVPVRNSSIRGPLAPDGDWIAEKVGRSGVPARISQMPAAEDMTYEIVNFMDGQRTVSEIRDAVSAEFEPVELGVVAEYIDLLARAGAVSFTK
jgi:hypothetical protein